MIPQFILKWIPIRTDTLEEFVEILDGENCSFIKGKAVTPTGRDVIDSCIPFAYIVLVSKTPDGRKVIYKEGLPCLKASYVLPKKDSKDILMSEDSEKVVPGEHSEKEKEAIRELYEYLEKKLGEIRKILPDIQSKIFVEVN